jgi:hypothetical protein
MLPAPASGRRVGDEGACKSDGGKFVRKLLQKKQSIWLLSVLAGPLTRLRERGSKLQLL